MNQSSALNNLLAELNATFGFSVRQIQAAIAARADVVDDELLNVEKWLKDVDEVPAWANRAAARWVIELWMIDRDTCDPTELLKVDKKYTRLLKSFTMAEIIAMRNEINRTKSL